MRVPNVLSNRSTQGDEKSGKLLHWAMPSEYQWIHHKNDLTRAMVAQSEPGFLAMAQGTAPTGTTAKILRYKGYKDTEPFFIKGERDEP